MPAKPKSKYVIALDDIQARVFEFLKPLGFRKKGRTFNREANEKGIYQVVHFQAGPYELAPPIPPYRLDLYGTFTINLGVLIKELYDMEEWHKPTTFYQEPFCQARTRLPTLLYGEDRWWSLESRTERTTQTVIDGFNSVGFEYFSLYESRQLFRSNYGRFQDCPPRAPLDIALMVFHADRTEGEELFRQYYKTDHRNSGHVEYLNGLAARLGISLP